MRRLEMSTRLLTLFALWITEESKGREIMIVRLVVTFLLFVAIGPTVARSQTAKPGEALAPSGREAQSSPHTLAFKDFLDSGAAELKPSAKLLALNGKRVRLIGFMVQMEIEPIGGFYLSSRPIFCDEEGGGTADLPPDSVFVIVSSYKDKKIPFMRGLLEITGTLELSRRESADGTVSFINLALEKPQGITTVSITP